MSRPPLILSAALAGCCLCSPSVRAGEPRAAYAFAVDEQATAETAREDSAAAAATARDGSAAEEPAAAEPTAAETAATTDAVFDSNGVMIRYVTAGQGQAVVLIHGWMADSSMWGRDAAGNTRLDTTDAEDFQAIALDCRGHGQSGKPHEPEKYGAEMAADVVRLLDHLKIEKAHLIGYSSGAFIAGHVAATHPERVLSVVYAGQAPIVAELMRPNDFAECELFARAVDEGKGLGPYVQAVTPANRPRPNDAQANAIAQFMFRGKDLKAMALAGNTFRELSVTADQLRQCKAPTLFIHGGNESEHVKGRVARVRELLDRSELKIVEGGDHMTTLAKPEFAAAVREFLRTGTLSKPDVQAAGP